MATERVFRPRAENLYSAAFFCVADVKWRVIVLADVSLCHSRECLRPCSYILMGQLIKTKCLLSTNFRTDYLTLLEAKGRWQQEASYIYTAALNNTCLLPQRQEPLEFSCVRPYV